MAVESLEVASDGIDGGDARSVGDLPGPWWRGASETDGRWQVWPPGTSEIDLIWQRGSSTILLDPDSHVGPESVADVGDLFDSLDFGPREMPEFKPFEGGVRPTEPDDGN